MAFYDPFLTPGINPTEDDGLSLMGRKKKPLGLGQPFKPIVAQPTGIPGGEMPQPMMEMPAKPPTPWARPLPDAAPVQPLGMVNRPTPTEAPGGPLQAPAPLSLDRRGVDLPALPGEPAAKPWSPVEQSRYDYMQGGLSRDEQGRERFKSSKGQVLGDFFRGLQRGGLPGAVAGAATAVFDPRAAREERFNATQLPRIQAAQQSADLERRREAEEQERQIKAKVQIAGIARDEQDFNLKWREYLMKEEEAKRKAAAEAAKLTEFDPTKDLRLPDGKIAYKGIPKTTPDRDFARYRTTSEGGVLDTTTGEVTFPNGRVVEGPQFVEKNVPDAARKLLGEIEDLRSANDKEGFNKKIQQLQGQFGDIYETGMGQGGWMFFKPKIVEKSDGKRRVDAPTPMRSGGNSAPAKTGASPIKRTVADVMKLFDRK